MVRLEQEFRLRGFRVAVPKSILKRWATVPVDEVCKIIDSVCVVYAMGNLRWAGARVEPSVVAMGLAAGEQMPTAAQIYHDFLNQQRSTRKKLTNTQVKDQVLWLLRFADYRDWNCSPIATVFRHAVAVAAIDGDQGFFKALGERLKEKPIPFKAPRKFSPLPQRVAKRAQMILRARTRSSTTRKNRPRARALTRFCHCCVESKRTTIRRE